MQPDPSTSAPWPLPQQLVPRCRESHSQRPGTGVPTPGNRIPDRLGTVVPNSRKQKSGESAPAETVPPPLLYCVLLSFYRMMPCALNILASACTPRSTCSSVWVAIRAKRTSVSCGAQAGGMTGLMNTPAS